MRINKIIACLVVCSLLLIPIFAYAVVLYPRSNSVKLAWNDDQTDIEYYEVILIRDGTGVIYGPYITILKTIEISRPKSGIYEVKVRGIRGGLYSGWCSSLGPDAVLTTGAVGQWKVYFKLRGPTGPIIIY